MGTWLTLQCKIITCNLGGEAEWCGKWKCTHTHFHLLSQLVFWLVHMHLFTFKVIINKHYYFLNYSEFVFFFFSFSCFLPRELPLAFVVKLIWWCWILLTFACLESFWFLHQILARVLLGRVFLVVVLPFHQFKHSVPFHQHKHSLWFIEFLLRNQLIAWWEFSCILLIVFSLNAFNILSWLTFVSLITMYLGLFLLGFILPGTLWDS